MPLCSHLSSLFLSWYLRWCWDGCSCWSLLLPGCWQSRLYSSSLDPVCLQRRSVCFHPHCPSSPDTESAADPWRRSFLRCIHLVSSTTPTPNIREHKTKFDKRKKQTCCPVFMLKLVCVYYTIIVLSSLSFPSLRVHPQTPLSSSLLISDLCFCS